MAAPAIPKQRSSPSLKHGATGPWVGPATYNPHIPDPKTKRLGMDPVLRDVKHGATSAFLAPKSTFFNILYTHPNFGPLGPWANQSADMLAPINSVAGTMVPASERLLQRQHGHDEVGIAAAGQHGDTAGMPQWGALGPGAKAAHLGVTFATRAAPREFTHPSSPSMHCQQTPPLPEMPRMRERKTSVPESTHPWQRTPPHRGRTTQVYEAMYGPKERKPQKAKGVLR